MLWEVNSEQHCINMSILASELAPPDANRAHVPLELSGSSGVPLCLGNSRVMFSKLSSCAQ